MLGGAIGTAVAYLVHKRSLKTKVGVGVVVILSATFITGAHFINQYSVSPPRRLSGTWEADSATDAHLLRIRLVDSKMYLSEAPIYNETEHSFISSTDSLIVMEDGERFFALKFIDFKLDMFWVQDEDDGIYHFHRVIE